MLRLNVAPKRKKEIRKLLLYLTNVELLNYHEINWQLNFNRNNQTYRMLIGICYLILNGLLQTQNDGTLKLMDFIDDQKMHRLYEKFILEYYRKEFPDVSVNASQIDWQLDTNEQSFLPIMQSDILLSYKKRILIIDAKYYTHILNSRFENETVQSANLYQIFTYVKNKQIEVGDDYQVSGMLLYAQTDEVNQLDIDYQMSGNNISIQTLDLNKNFEKICMQLDLIAEKYVGIQRGK